MRLAIILAIILPMVIGSGACSSKPETISVGWSPFEHAALFYIAEDQNFFNSNNLSITPHKYDSGAGSLNGMLNGEADMVVGVTEFPLVAKALQKERVGTIASIARSDIIYLVARKDRGIEKPADLKGKRVGTTLGTIAEFYLGRFLYLNNMSMQDITLVDVKSPSDWVEAVVKGDIDAISTAQPYANSARERLGANAVVWPAQSKQPMYSLIVTTNEWITQHPNLATRFLRSLAQAEEYIIRNPGEAKAIIQKRLNLDAVYVETVWSQNQFGLSLDQSLVVAMEDESRWMISNNLTTEKTVPDFMDYIYPDGLKAFKPGAVNISK